ncbi:hypothetical protein, partial [Xenorhabdus nematophila]|uniref:hypothetical protein n=1 Tax=Xenorhabdus nematophila TaxID=628 RepID=UPI001E52BF28
RDITAKEISLKKPAGVMITAPKFSLAECKSKYARALHRSDGRCSNKLSAVMIVNNGRVGR